MHKKFGIIAAMDEELEILRDKMSRQEKSVFAELPFYEGTLDGVPVVLCRCGIGKVNAGMATAILNQVYKPDAVLNTGSAGGLSANCSIGDIVLGSSVLYHDVDATVFGYRYGQVPREPETFLADTELLRAGTDAAQELQGVQVHVGMIASGDSFMNDAERVNYVSKRLPGLLAAEMEGAAIAQVCRHFGIPALIIRAISDVAGVESKVTHEEFLQMASENSAKLVQGVIRLA